MKKKQTTIKEVKEMLEKWRDTDMARAGKYYNHVENKHNREAFERGYRYALMVVIDTLDTL